MQSSKPDYANRIFGLDLLRSVAILTVVWQHGRYILTGIVNTKAYNFLILDGVSIFFVLSGFLIGGILIKTINETGFGRKELLRFWIRRWFRTLPNYLLVLTILVAHAIWFDPESIKDVGLKLLSYYVFLQNFAWNLPGFFPESWSLTVEEWFYLLVPLFLYLSFKNRKWSQRKVLLFWIILLIIIPEALRFYNGFMHPYDNFLSWAVFVGKVVVTRIDGIMYGVGAAYLFYYKPQLWDSYRNLKFAAGLLLLFIPQIITTFYPFNFFFTTYLSVVLSAVATILLLPKALIMKAPGQLIFKGVNFISKISYSMYLLNLSVVYVLILKINPDETHSFRYFVFTYFLFWAVTIALSYLLYRFYEMPMMKLRDKFFKK